MSQGTTKQRSTTTSCDVPSECDIAGVPIDLRKIKPLGTNFGADNIRTAGVLHIAHLHGYQMGYFRAVDDAISLIDRNRIPLDIDRDRELADAINGWRLASRRITDERAAVMAARVLGFHSAAVPEAERNTAFHGLIGDLLDAAKDFGRVKGGRPGQESHAEAVLSRAFARAQANLAWSVSLITAIDVRHLVVRLKQARTFLRAFADHIPTGHLSAQPRTLRSLSWLAGTGRDTDRVTLMEDWETTWAWTQIYRWLTGSLTDLSTSTSDDVVKAALILRPATDVARGVPT